MPETKRLADIIGESPFFVAMFVARIAARLNVDKEVLATRLIDVVLKLKGE